MFKDLLFRYYILKYNYLIHKYNKCYTKYKNLNKKLDTLALKRYELIKNNESKYS